MENPDPDESGARWMTYRELAAALSISLPAAEARVRRGKWRKQEGNDGALRVSVPLDVLLPPPATAQGPQVADLLAELKAAHEATVEELRRRTEAAEAQAEGARALAEKRAEDLAAMAQKLGHAEALGEAKLRQVEEAESRAVTAEGRAAMAETEVASWTEGTPFKRAMRALMWRRG